MFFNAFIAIIPILLVLILMVIFKQPAVKVMFLGWLATVIIAFSHWLIPIEWIGAATLRGIFMALDIIILIFGALLLYHYIKLSGGIEIITKKMLSLSADKRIQIGVAFLLIAVIEGIVGFGVPGVIVAPLLIVMGFAPIIAASLVLFLNSVSASFGAVGIPVWGGIGAALNSPGVIQELAIHNMTLQSWLNIDITFWTAAFHSIVAIFLPLIGAIFFIKWSGGKIKEVKSAIPSLLLAGLSFAIPYFLLAKFIGPEFPSLIGGIVGLIIYSIALKYDILEPKIAWDFLKIKNKEKNLDKENVQVKALKKSSYIMVIMPYILVILALSITRIIGPIRYFLGTVLVHEITNIFGTNIGYIFRPFYNPGIIFILIFCLYAVVFRIKTEYIIKTFKTTIKAVIPAAIALFSAVALSQIMIKSGYNLSNLDNMLRTIAEVTALSTGYFYILLAPLVGALGAYMTGSVTVSNILFSGFQFEIAGMVDISKTMLLALQNIGGGIGNMISIHNIVAVATICGILGREGEIIKKNLLPMFLYGAFVGILGFIFIFIIRIYLF